jgi:hypothetical protein
LGATKAAAATSGGGQKAVIGFWLLDLDWVPAIAVAFSIGNCSLFTDNCSLMTE